MLGWRMLARTVPSRGWPAHRVMLGSGQGSVPVPARPGCRRLAGAGFISRRVLVSDKVLGWLWEVCVKWNRTSKQFQLCGWFGESPFSKSKSKALIEGPALGSFLEMTARARHFVSCDLSCVAVT